MAVDRGPRRGRRAGREQPAAARDGLLAGLRRALPDPPRHAADRRLPAEGAGVPGPLLNLVLLHNFAERSAIASAVLAGDANFLRVLRHCADSQKLGGRDWAESGPR